MYCTTPVMGRRCITPGHGDRPAVAGRSRCSKCGPSTPKGHGTAYGYAHQQDRLRVAKAGNLTCGICLLPILPGQPWHLDHVLPISLGGRNGPKRAAHERCNIAKGGANRLNRN